MQTGSCNRLFSAMLYCYESKFNVLFCLSKLVCTLSTTWNHYANISEDIKSDEYIHIIYKQDKSIYILNKLCPSHKATIVCILNLWWNKARPDRAATRKGRLEGMYSKSMSSDHFKLNLSMLSQVKLCNGVQAIWMFAIKPEFRPGLNNFHHWFKFCRLVSVNSI